MALENQLSGMRMFSVNLGSGRAFRLAMLGFATVTVALTLFPDEADARRYRRHRAYHHRVHYSPPFASIVVDANSGSVLQQREADAQRHPASLTKIMTLYLLFEQLEAGKVALDTRMSVSDHAQDQAPTKLGLREGQTLTVEDAIKGLVTKSANDAAVVIAETLGGSEENFARLMTRKARALGMSRTVYRNASGLPDTEQVTTARDQALLGRAIQERFPRYYKYFQTTAFHYRGRVIRNHNRLLGRVEGCDGIKTGYTRSSGFNLVSSVRRGNRYIVAVVLGGRSAGARDATMRNLIDEHIEDASPRRSVAAIVERDDASPSPKPARLVESAAAKVTEPPTAATRTRAMEPPALVPTPSARPTAPTADASEPTALSSGVVSQPLSLIPGTAEPIRPVRVKTVIVKSGRVKTAANGPVTIPGETASIAVKSEQRAAAGRGGTIAGVGHGLMGTPLKELQEEGDAEPWPRPHLGKSDAFDRQIAGPRPGKNAEITMAALPPASVQTVTAKVAGRSGWIIQVGAFDNEDEARQRLDRARDHARTILGRADPFTETVARGNKTLYRARFAGFEKDEAEQACRALKRSAISCITVKN